MLFFLIRFLCVNFVEFNCFKLKTNLYKLKGNIRGLIGNADIISESFLLFLIENQRDHIQSVLYLSM